MDDDEFLRSLGIDPADARELAESYGMPFSGEEIDVPLEAPEGDE